ncbi:MAG: sensory box histidine kinase/response regulator [Candidatus Magnetoglobus multicellularis str. Araruama]|uniref:Sensory/regulatory protein RpfC n=1 Tax=Candidatus Magnetoglobus multicellularis str. Araruama TaxID=890399 RepID=A0A1V1P839_9BACT|nr:MAG: sensory box histidine kinase/response regulator [Candidatus Magnetoglobus multicellularis str. Araruama]
MRIYQVELELQNEELIKSREQLEKSQQYMADLFQQAPLGYIILSMQSTIIDLNHMVTKYFGIQRESMLNQRFQSYVPESSIVAFKHCFNALSHTQKIQSAEIQFSGRMGRRFWTKMTISLLEHPEDGQQILCALVDITQEKEQEQALIESLFLKELLNVFPLPVFYTDNQGKLIGFNRCFINYTGMPERQLRQSKASEIILQDTEDCPDALNINTFRTGSIQRYDIVFRHADNTLRNITLKLSAYENRQKNISGVIGVMVDITEHRVLQQDLETTIQKVHLYAQKAEIASQTKTQFLANMSHEIRTPMNAIMGMLEILLSTTHLTEEQNDYISVALESAQNLLVIINDILDISKIEAKKITLDERGFDFYKLIQSLYKTMRVQASQKGLDFYLDIHPDVNQYFMGDPHRIRQILLNIVANAIKFTEKGRVSIKIFQKEMKNNEETRLYFEVSDTGEGIPPEKHSLIFDSFTQNDGSMTRKYGGTGLGLTISKQLCELMGGRITVNSTPGKGSTFYFYLILAPISQLDESDEDVKPHDMRSAQSGQIQQILLVEDMETNIKVATIFLKRLGMEVTVANDGFKAIKMLKNGSFDCVLMDIEMPGISGFETTHRIRAGEAGDNNMDIIIIAMTAHATQGFENKCLQANMNGYISKPVKIETLKSVLETARKVEKDQNKPLPVLSISELMNEFADESIVNEVLAQARKDMLNFLADAENAALNKDYKQLQYNAHALMGIAKNIGAKRMITSSSHLEKCFQTENMAAVPHAFAEMKGDVHAVLKEIGLRLDE